MVHRQNFVFRDVELASHVLNGDIFRYDDGVEWEQVYTANSSKDQIYPVNIIPRRCHKYRWRIEGKGQMKLIGMSRDVEGGSEISHGYLSFGYRR